LFLILLDNNNFIKKNKANGLFLYSFLFIDFILKNVKIIMF